MHPESDKRWRFFTSVFQIQAFWNTSLLKCFVDWIWMLLVKLFRTVCDEFLKLMERIHFKKWIFGNLSKNLKSHSFRSWHKIVYLVKSPTFKESQPNPISHVRIQKKEESYFCNERNGCNYRAKTSSRWRQQFTKYHILQQSGTKNKQ